MISNSIERISTNCQNNWMSWQKHQVVGNAIYRRRKFDVEPVFGHMKRDFGIRRTHLRGQRAVENDIGLALMALNLTKFGQSISRLATNFINNLKSGL
ncbi:transposase [Limosilactobacillus reuteri]|uniref:transposase n=1 Tax=Limosilactobacillus reuteri TaxID=1598 RepID=UPI002F261484